MKENDMITIAEASKQTKVPRATIRYWARTGQLSEAELKETLLGSAWFTTIKAVKEREANRGAGGRPRKKPIA